MTCNAINAPVIILRQSPSSSLNTTIGYTRCLG